MAEYPWQKNITNVTKSIYSQVLGAEFMAEDGNLKAIEAGDLVSIGKAVLDMDNGLEKMAKSMVVVIGKIEFDEFFGENLRLKQMFTDSWEYGNIYEVVQVNPQSLITEDLYNLTDGKDYSSVENTYYAPKLTVKVYNNLRTFTLAVSFARDRLAVAVQNQTQLNEVISSIRNQIATQLRETWYAQALVLLGSAICTSVKTTKTAIHLLSEAKEIGILAEAATVNDARKDDNFLAFAMRRIATVREQMKMRTCAFNNKVVPVATGKVDLYLLNDFEKDTRFGVYRNSYNPDTLNIGTYDVVQFWQGHKTTESSNSTITEFSFANNSTVMIDDTKNELGIGSSVTVTNVIGLLCDHKAVAMLNQREYVESKYVSSARFWTDFFNMEINPILNPNYPIVAICLD